MAEFVYYPIAAVEPIIHRYRMITPRLVVVEIFDELNELILETRG